MNTKSPIVSERGTCGYVSMLKNIPLKKPFIFLVAALALAGCESEDEKLEKLLVGSWSCTTQLPSSAGQPSGSVKMDIQYLSSKKSSSQAIFSLSQDGVTIDLEMIASGTWDIVDGNLEEEITRVTIMGVRGPGGSFSMSQLPADAQREFNTFKEAFQEMAGVTEIRDITETRLDLYEPISRSHITCSSL